METLLQWSIKSGTTPEHTNCEHETENLNENAEISPPTYNEVDIIQKLGNNKAPGPDIIISELIKERRLKLKHRIHMLILKIWEKKNYRQIGKTA